MKKSTLNLSAEEQSWLAGDGGPALKRAVEIIVALGNIYGATRLIPVKSVQISGVSYRNLGQPGLDFLQRWAAEGAKVRVPTTLNPTAMDMENWAAQGFSGEFAQKQQAVVAAFSQMGVGGGHPVPTCTPYLVGNVPALGDDIAWAESSAVVYANSVLGARTNREGGPGAVAAAITGRTAAYGLHLVENRLATLKVEVKAQPRTISEYSALGALVGQQAGKQIPYFVGLPLEPGSPLALEKLKALGAAMAATGAVALYHVEGITPEARNAPMLATAHQTLVIDDYRPGYALLSDPVAKIDLIWVGCPHSSLAEIAWVAEALAGRKLTIPLWVTCARPVKELALQKGLVDIIESAGGQVFSDACMSIAPVKSLGFNAVATPSAKAAFYLRNLAGVLARFCSLERCIETALDQGREV
ncbi:MAG: aconitase X catalytic domain-containing protein [Anaerolineae bacterium]|nr:aconitase X catalytic domain-containing protein [Anaerolineae bacterium]